MTNEQLIAHCVTIAKTKHAIDSYDAQITDIDQSIIEAAQRIVASASTTDNAWHINELCAFAHKRAMRNDARCLAMCELASAMHRFRTDLAI